MLLIVAISLILGVVIVRRKWRNAAVKKAEIVRLVAEEEAEIAVVGGYSCIQRVEVRYYCAVCRCAAATTRCSQCKGVRYCSGKCQIIHWRQGHKDDCRPVTPLHATKERELVLEENPFKNKFYDEAKICSDSKQLDNSGSSSSSSPCFSYSTEGSETTLDASISEVPDSGTPIRAHKLVSESVDSYMSQPASDSDEDDVSSVSPMSSAVYAANNTLDANKIKRAQATKPDDGFQKKGFKDKRAGNEADVLEEFVLGARHLRSYHSSISLKTPSSVENHRNQVHPSIGKVTKPMYYRESGNHQVLNVDLRSSQCSKSLSMSSSEEYWENGAKMRKGKETRSMSFRSSENDQRMCRKSGITHTLLSEAKDVQMLSQPTNKVPKTSFRKFAQHFRRSKQSKSYTFDTGKDSAGNYRCKIIFPPKLFMQLYSCDGAELHPFGLLNYGNSCYANAVLQCLTFTRPITSYLLQGLHSKTCYKTDWCLICEFERLIRRGQETSSPLFPVGILSQIQRIGSHLSHGREEDAHDFLRNVVDTMQSIWLEEVCFSGSSAEDSTLLGLTFGGYLRSKIKCLKCLGRSEQCDRIMDLTVEIDGDISMLEEALAQFTISETLGGDDKYMCSRCKSYEKARKKLTIIEAPNILTIVLKRFRSGNAEKLNKLVQFPEVLNLAPYMSGMSDKYPIYHLYAVVVHLDRMNAAYSSHYISYIKDFRGEWFRIDDSRVSHVDLDTVLSVEAYILFYARHTPRGPSLVTNSSVHSDGKTKRNMEAISASTITKKKNGKPKSSSLDWHVNPDQQQSERHSYRMPRHDFKGNHNMGSKGWRSPMMDSSDSSSIFSASDAGSCSTDSTKDSTAEDLSGYIFGSSLYHI